MIDEEEVLSNLENVDKKEELDIPSKLTILPLRDIIIFPNMIFPVLIGRASTLKAVAEAVERDKFIFVVSQKNAETDDPGFKDIYKYGTVAKIIQVLRLPNNLLKVLVEGVFQGRIKKQVKNNEFLEAEITVVEPKYNEKDKEFGAMVRHTSELFSEYVKSSNMLPPDIIGAFDNIDDPVRKLFYAAANLQTKIATKQSILDQRSLKKQYFELSSILTSELEILKIEDEIDTKVHDSIQKTQKKFYIQEQIRALQQELGEEDSDSPEISKLRKALEAVDFPEAIQEVVNEELDRLRKTPTMSPDFAVNRTYLEWMSQLPWNKFTDDNLSIKHVQKVLDDDHYNLIKAKERIIEFISILNLSGNLKKQIICLVGPPGVGKTSLGKSIANALNRKFVRISLGGVRDEAEIRGHRKTYIGAMPGKIIQSMKKAGTSNPVILLDEIDKMAMDFRGDPSSALLEVLDPEQNVTFNDHYLEVDYDLSNVMFITTANVKYDIPGPLLDRMEVIELSSYLEYEKIQIAKRHIIPKLIKEYGLSDFNIKFEDKAIEKVISEYTKESGVRNLERTIASVFRKLTKEIVGSYTEKLDKPITTKLVDDPKFIKSVKKTKFVIDIDKIEELLKAPTFLNKEEDIEAKVGVARGLAWTSVGGDTMPIEVNIIEGVEKLTLTGKLGDVMKESAVAALSYLRANMKELGIPSTFNKKKEIHIHVPEGAIPKDGPSAGITMALALLSAATGRKLRGDLAMTGEITLRGNILAIGGLNEKLLAAKKIGIKTVFIPFDNKKDLADVDNEVKKGLEIIPVKHLSESLKHAFADKKVSSKKKKV